MSWVGNITALSQLVENPKTKLESDEFLSSVDLICEGPIAGLVDSDGNILKYLSNKDYSNIILGKGVYYNNVPLIDSKLNKFNFVTQGFSIFYGSENNDGFYDFPSTVFNYRQNLLLNEKDFAHVEYNGGQWQSIPNSNYGFEAAKNFTQKTSYIHLENGIITKYGFLEGGITSNSSLSAGDIDVFNKWLDNIKLAKNYCNPFIHEIKNRFADQITVNISADQVFRLSGNGSTRESQITFVVELFEDGTNDSVYITSSIVGISKSNYVSGITFDLNLNPFLNKKYYIRVYPLTRKVAYDDAKLSLLFGVSSIVESMKKKGKFCYPYSAVVKSSVSSKHFKNDPDRTFDLKLLKIKVPNNYDPEAKEYSGNWDGNFSNFLRWTDNPAWIFYDICTNNRYGVGNGKVLLEDLNKWELYKIAKYCDELVVSTSPRGASEDYFTYYPNYKWHIFLSKTSQNGQVNSLTDIKNKYHPNYSSDNINYTNNNGGAYNSVIFLYDINDGEVNNARKIVQNIEEGNMMQSATDENIFEFQSTPEGEGSVFRFHLMPYIGPTMAFEKEQTGNMIKTFRDKMVSDSSLVDNKSIVKLENLLNESKKNTQHGAVNHILEFITTNWWQAGYDQLKSDYANTPIFSASDSGQSLNGKCLPRVLGYRDPLESRFTANVLIDNETECLKLLNDITSIFRGLTYYRNNLITTTIDVSKPISYMFNNTNVKDGIFTYSTGSVDGNYSVAKILYKDRYNKFEDEVEVVEDSELIKEYGIVSKEILGFGVTSRDQARRMGLWLLATNRFENNAITFSTDMQGIILKPGDVIQIEDSFKSDYLLQGRVVSVDRSNKYIVVDRKIDVRFAGSKIKFLCDKTYDSYKDISNSDQFDNQEREDVIELYIERIENDTNRIYIREPLDSNGNVDVEAFSNFYKISGSSPFIIQSDIVYSSIDKEDESQESDSLDNKNLYKIVSIAEQDVNEYSIFAIKYDRNKYLSLDNNIIDVRSGVSKNTINYSSSENITEVDLTGMQGSYYSLDRKSITQIGQLDFDYSFSESESALEDDSSDNYAVLTLKFDVIKNYIDTQASLNNEYYVKVDQILSSGGGFVCKIISKNQSIRFKVPITNAEQKTIFLGKFPEEVSNVVSSASSIKIYIYDVENKIIEV